MKQLTLIAVILLSMPVFAEEKHGDGPLPKEATDALLQRDGLSKEKFDKFKTYLINACQVTRPAAPSRSPGIDAGAQGAVANPPATTPSASTGTRSVPDTSTSSTGRTAGAADTSFLSGGKCISCHAAKSPAQVKALIEKGGQMTGGPNINTLLSSSEIASIRSFTGN